MQFAEIQEIIERDGELPIIRVSWCSSFDPSGDKYFTYSKARAEYIARSKSRLGYKVWIDNVSYN